jgi:hypothetical protein
MISVRKDMRNLFGAARDQGLRPTCLCFATSDAHAVHRASPFTQLSVEYLYYMGVQRSAKPPSSSGVSVKSITLALDLDGQPLESSWTYLPALPNPLSNWKPPVFTEVFKRKLESKAFSIEKLMSTLDSDVSGILVVKISQAFYSPDQEGFVDSPAGDRDTGTHAVVALGHGRRGTTPVILVRNSWGTDWGVNGYGWLTADYLTIRTLCFSTVK